MPKECYIKNVADALLFFRRDIRWRVEMDPERVCPTHKKRHDYIITSPLGGTTGFDKTPEDEAELVKWAKELYGTCLPHLLGDI